MNALTPCPTFIDLRAFAAGVVAGADPFGADCARLPLRPAPVEIGAIALAAGSGVVDPLAGDWWLIAATGEAMLEDGTQRLTLAGNQSCVIPAGTAFRWQSEAGATLLFMRYTQGEGAPAGLVPVDLAATLVPSGPPLADLLVGETPACRNHTDYRSADGVFTCGVWDSTPYHRRPMRYVHFELMVLLLGSVAFVDERGEAGTFRQGDIFLVEQGASCSWESREQVAKIYAIYRPLA